MKGIPAALLAMTPCMNHDGYAMLKYIAEHPCAPRWNFEIGDMLLPGDHAEVDEFRRRTGEGPMDNRTGRPPEFLLEWILAMRKEVPAFAERIPEGFDLEEDWVHVPTMSREDLACRIEDVVPSGAELERLIVYDTSGTTGHALLLPHHPLAVAKNHALCEYALARHGVDPAFGPGMTACMNVCAQRNTYVFCNVFTVWGQSGFAKVNLSPGEWSGGVDSARRFCSDLDPALVTTDPVSLAEITAWDLPLRPKAVISTALALDPRLAADSEKRLGCPVIDWYSTTETGPIAFSSPDGEGYEAVAPDLFVELLDEDGMPVAEGEWGEITVTGGRNPYLPLLRYRCGDMGRCRTSPWRLLEIQGRKARFFRAADGGPVGTVDISRAMRLASPFAQHSLAQREDGSIRLRLRPLPGYPVVVEAVRNALEELFGKSTAIEILVDEAMHRRDDDGKLRPWIDEEDGED